MLNTAATFRLKYLTTVSLTTTPCCTVVSEGRFAPDCCAAFIEHPDCTCTHSRNREKRSTLRGLGDTLIETSYQLSIAHVS